MTTQSTDYAFVDQCPVIPVMVIQRVEDAVPMARALVNGGITTLEITLRTACALEAIAEIARDVPEAMVGAGTVCNASQFDAAVSAGARFVVSPGHSQALFEASRSNGTPFLPGAVTATEVMAVLDAGFPVVKFFPASTSGGAPAIKALGGPFAHARFVPTGGIGPANIGDYLSLASVAAVGGSWMLPSDQIDAGNWADIEQRAAEAISLASSITKP